MRVVHAADVHLDTPFRRHDAALRQRLQQAGRDALRALVDLTLEERADALLIAGDLFDNEWLTIATERVLTRRAGPAYRCRRHGGLRNRQPRPRSHQLPRRPYRLAVHQLSPAKLSDAPQDSDRSRR